MPPPPGPGDRRRQLRNLAPLLAVCTLVASLMLTAVVQGVLLHRQDQRVTALETALADSDRSAARARGEVADLQRRASTLEARTRGAIDTAAVAKQVTPSVFRVTAGSSTGSAFAFGARPDGGGTSLLTNFHVVSGIVDAGGSTVTLEREGRSFTARIGRTDRGRDLAVLETDALFRPLRAASAEVQPGAPVVVVGAPLGLVDSITTGVVSALRPRPDGAEGQFIQFDAAISPGNSGGPLVDADGRVVGVAQAKLVQEGVEGISIAIPIAEACDGLGSC
jgi:S1-C subfamily serine protease